MAEEVTIEGAGSTAKIRSVIWVPVLVLITLGIYGAFWWYFVHRELRELSRSLGREALDEARDEFRIAREGS